MADTSQHPEIHRADPALRRQMLMALLLCLVIGTAGLWGLHSWLDHLLRTLGSSDPLALEIWLRRMLAGAALLVASGMAGAAIWLGNLAIEGAAEERWPPAGLRTSRDLPVLRGTAAAKTIRQLRVAAMTLGVTAAAVLLWAIWLGWPDLR